MNKKELIKHIAFIVLVPSVLVGSYYGYKFIKKKWDDKKALTEKQKLDNEMRDKYKDINSFADFYEGVKYQPSNSYFGYDLTLLKDVPNLEKKITLEELKALYKISQKEPKDVTDDEGTQFTELYNKAKN